MPKRKWLFAGLWLASLAFAMLLGAALFWKREALPIPQAVKATVKQLVGAGPPPRSDPENQNTYTTTLLSLQGTRYSLPKPLRAGDGGGITAYGEHVIVLGHDGQFHAVHPDTGPTKLDIAPPPSGFADYKRAAEGRFKDGYQHRFGWFRYVDVAYYEREGVHGLLAGYLRFDDANSCVRTLVSKLEVPSDSDLLALGPVEEGDWVDVYRSEPCLPLKTTRNAIEGHMGGGRMVLAPGGPFVFLAVGDYHWDGTIAPRSLPGAAPGGEPVSVAQDPDGHYGKIMQIDYTTGQAAIFSKGHRNPQGLAFDQQGRLWAVEHGPFNGDELNLVRRGGNYGWPEVTLGDPTYTGTYAVEPGPGSPSYGAHDGFDKPVMSWSPSIAPSGLTTVRDFDPAWDGDLLAITLKRGALVRIRISDEGTAYHSEEIEIGSRLRDIVMVGPRIAVWTNDRTVLFLEPRQDNTTRVSPKDVFSAISTPATPDALALLESCTQCHSLSPGQRVAAPSLAEFYKAGMGGSAYANYSAALKRDGRAWSPELLKAYLKDPSSVVPGTAMPSQGEISPEALDTLVNALIEWNEIAQEDQAAASN